MWIFFFKVYFITFFAPIDKELDKQDHIQTKRHEDKRFVFPIIGSIEANCYESSDVSDYLSENHDERETARGSVLENMYDLIESGDAYFIKISFT